MKAAVIVLLVAPSALADAGAARDGAASVKPVGSDVLPGWAEAHATGLPVVVACPAGLEAAVRAGAPGCSLVSVSPTGFEPAPDLGRLCAAAVRATGQASAWLVLAAGRGSPAAATLLAVLARLGQCPVVYAQHRGRAGYPLGFAAEMVSELMALDGDESLRRLLGRFAAEAVVVDDPGVFADPRPGGPWRDSDWGRLVG